MLIVRRCFIDDELHVLLVCKIYDLKKISFYFINEYPHVLVHVIFGCLPQIVYCYKIIFVWYCVLGIRIINKNTMLQHTHPHPHVTKLSVLLLCFGGVALLLNKVLSCLVCPCLL